MPLFLWETLTSQTSAGNTTQSHRFLECVGDNFLTQLVSEPIREGALLDLLFVSREGLVDDVAVGGQLGHNDHEIRVLYS